MEPEFAEQNTDFEALFEKMSELLQSCQFRSAVRLCGEIQRAARGERRLDAYMRAVFHQMDLNKDLFEPQLSRDKAVELIALLENRERGRLIQDDFDETVYDHNVAWMSACAYENLADATGMSDGYNSEGMHACIADGISVCQRTGKLACINCFREYATEVYSAADDLYMALHQARTIANNNGRWSDRGDRRWLGAKDAAWLLLLQGDADAAGQHLDQSATLSKADTVSLPLQARLRLSADRHNYDILVGKANLDVALKNELPVGEIPMMDYRWALAESLRLLARGDYAASEAILGEYDRRLLQKGCLSDWFETRLRLLALRRLSGNESKLDALAQPLVDRAKKSRDWLTLHRLSRLFDPTESATPLALLAPLKIGPFASHAQASVPAEPPTDEAPLDAESDSEPDASPLEDTIQALFAKLGNAGDDEAALTQIGNEVLALDPARVTTPGDAARLLFLLLCVPATAANAEPIWAWAESVAPRFSQVPVVLNMVAALGDSLLDVPETSLEAKIDKSDLERRFRQSLELDPFDPNNHARAGSFYLRRDNLGEAERCLARGFRLMRTHPFLASNLASVYDRTDRPNDALAVLDLALREGCEDPGIAWQAALKAFQLEQYDSLLTYLDRFDALVPKQPWANYYRAIGCLETGKLSEAATALDAEAENNPTATFAIVALRTCVLARQGDDAACRASMEQVLSHRLVTVDYLSFQGLTGLFARLWTVAFDWPEDDPLRTRLLERMLVAGLAPDAYFDGLRNANEVSDGIQFYRCIVRQPLDADWPESEGCLAHQTEWTSFDMAWGVLARSEAEAAERVTAWQTRSFPTPCEMIQCELISEGFTDRPGVVWQGERSHEE